MAGDERDAERGGLEEHLAGALGGGGGPVTLIEALSTRLVEETRREVSVATRAVAELAGRIGQLEHDLGHLRHLVEHAAETRSAAPAAASAAGLDEVVQLLDTRLGHLDSRLEEAARVAGRVEEATRRLPEQAGPARPPVALEALRAELTALRSAVEGLARGDQRSEPRAAPEPVDLSPVTEAMGAGLAGLRAAVEALAQSLATPAAAPRPPDLTPVTETVGRRADELRTLLDEIAERVVGRAGTADVQELGERMTAHVATVQTAIDQLTAAVAASAAPPPPDLTVVTDGLAALRVSIEQLASAAPPPPDLGPVLEAIDQQGLGHRAAVEGLTRALADDHEAVVAQVGERMDAVAPLAGQVDELRARLEAVAAEQREHFANAVERVVEAVDRGRATVDERLVDVAALGERTDAMAGLVAQVAEQVSATRAGLDRWGDPEASRATQQQAVDAVAARLEERLQAHADGVDAGLAAARAAVDELRAELHGELTGTAGFPAQAARLDELQAAVAGIQETVGALRQEAGSAAMAAAVAPHAELIAERLTADTTILKEAVEQVRADAAARAQAVEEAVARATSDAAARAQAVEEAMARANSDAATRAQAVETAVAAATDRLGERLDQGLGAAVDAVTAAVAEIRAVMDERGPVPELERALTVLTEIRWDVEATQERVSDVDRKLGGLRSDLADTAQLTHAGFQAAEAVNAGLTAVARLERRLDADLDSMTRQLDALAAAVELSVTAAGRPRDMVTRDQVAERVGQRLARYREVAAGVRDAVREDIRRRRGGGELGPGQPTSGGSKRH